MQGVEFLNSEEVLVKEKFNWKWFLIANILTWVTCIIVGFYIQPEMKNHLIGFSSLGVFSIVYGLFFGWIMGGLNAIPVKHVKQYQVALLDECAFKELEEKYEIIDRDGKLLTIREIT